MYLYLIMYMCICIETCARTDMFVCDNIFCACMHVFLYGAAWTLRHTHSSHAICVNSYVHIFPNTRAFMHVCMRAYVSMQVSMHLAVRLYSLAGCNILAL